MITSSSGFTVNLSGQGGIVAHKWGEWGVGGDRNRVRVYLLGKSNGTADLVFRINDTRTTASSRITVAGMEKSAGELRSLTADVISRSKGKLSFNGSKFGYAYSGTIRYKNGRFIFTDKLNNDKIKGTVRLTMNKKFTSGEVTFKGIIKSGNKSFTAKATILPDEYVIGSKPVVQITKNGKKVRKATIANNLYDALSTSASIWNMVLMEQTQTDLRSIGFTKFIGKYA